MGQESMNNYRIASTPDSLLRVAAQRARQTTDPRGTRGSTGTWLRFRYPSAPGARYLMTTSDGGLEDGRLDHRGCLRAAAPPRARWVRVVVEHRSAPRAHEYALAVGRPV